MATAQFILFYLGDYAIEICNTPIPRSGFCTVLGLKYPVRAVNMTPKPVVYVFYII